MTGKEGKAFNQTAVDAHSYNDRLGNTPGNFSEELESSDERIDCDHRNLLRLAFDLNAAVLTGTAFEIVTDIMQKLSRYVRKHFDAEEELMIQTGYPQLPAHHS